MEESGTQYIGRADSTIAPRGYSITPVTADCIISPTYLAVTLLSEVLSFGLWFSCALLLCPFHVSHASSLLPPYCGVSCSRRGRLARGVAPPSPGDWNGLGGTLVAESSTAHSTVVLGVCHGEHFLTLSARLMDCVCVRVCVCVCV